MKFRNILIFGICLILIMPIGFAYDPNKAKELPITDYLHYRLDKLGLFTAFGEAAKCDTQPYNSVCEIGAGQGQVVPCNELWDVWYATGGCTYGGWKGEYRGGQVLSDISSYRGYIIEKYRCPISFCVDDSPESSPTVNNPVSNYVSPAITVTRVNFANEAYKEGATVRVDLMIKNTGSATTKNVECGVYTSDYALKNFYVFGILQGTKTANCGSGEEFVTTQRVNIENGENDLIMNVVFPSEDSKYANGQSASDPNGKYYMICGVYDECGQQHISFNSERISGEQYTPTKCKWYEKVDSTGIINKDYYCAFNAGMIYLPIIAIFGLFALFRALPLIIKVVKKK